VKYSTFNITPYKTELKPEVSYTWSNGDSGLETLMTHDGPIEVSAHIGNCSTSEQIDLPIDLEALAWIFPEGCYSTCYKDYIGYIIGPFGEFEEWIWLQDNQPHQYGAGSVEDLPVFKDHDYGLYLATEDCNLQLGNLTITNDEPCPQCKLDVKLKSVDCLGGQEGYAVNLMITNGFGHPMGANLIVPGGEGFFMNSGLTLNPGMNDNLILYFIPSNNFVPGQEFEIFIEGNVEGKQCMDNFHIRFPSCQTGHSFEPDKEEGFSLSLNPNPTRNYQTQAFYDIGSEEGNYQLVIRDLYGRSLVKKKIDSNSDEILLDCSGLAQGTYMVCLQRGEQILKAVKLIVK